MCKVLYIFRHLENVFAVLIDLSNLYIKNNCNWKFQIFIKVQIKLDVTVFFLNCIDLAKDYTFSSYMHNLKY